MPNPYGPIFLPLHLLLASVVPIPALCFVRGSVEKKWTEMVLHQASEASLLAISNARSFSVSGSLPSRFLTQRQRRSVADLWWGCGSGRRSKTHKLENPPTSAPLLKTESRIWLGCRQIRQSWGCPKLVRMPTNWTDARTPDPHQRLCLSTLSSIAAGS
ncbi:unnamed protein product [Linum trigynum]|uniref:Secreted protein n=1 Tax=Linum trigynum TaxID=586398 RepID=A0AAV2GNE5_9ROSI